jgi:uncharacterized membrane protein (UPF0182 family)
MDDTLDAALEKIFIRGETGRPSDAERPAGATAVSALAPMSGRETVEDLAKLARQHYERAIEAQRNGDWAQYGDQIRQLGAVLSRMSGTPAPPAAMPKK